MPEVDVAIVGGGCAGLSLAARLAVPGGPSCRVLEARTAYSNDRTWCFWDTGGMGRREGEWELPVDASWPAWSLRAGGVSQTLRSEDFRYTCITGGRFYAACLDRIGQSSNVRISMQTEVTEISAGGHLHLRGPDGDALRARHIIDTRPRRPRKNMLLQHFRGWEIVAGSPVFDPAETILMDFDVPQAGGIHFIYVLPFSDTRALVEATVISPEPWPEDAYARSIEAYLHDRFGLHAGGYAVIREESGILPMGHCKTPHQVDGVVAFGGSAGAMKTSSGYAFPFLQKQADSLARALLAGKPPALPPARSPLLAWMDACFLEVLQAHAQLAPHIFARLFTALSGDRFAHFMMDQPTLSDLLAVVTGLPTMPFLKGAMRMSMRR